MDEEILHRLINTYFILAGQTELLSKSLDHTLSEQCHKQTF